MRGEVPDRIANAVRHARIAREHSAATATCVDRRGIERVEHHPYLLGCHGPNGAQFVEGPMSIFVGPFILRGGELHPKKFA
jgi:hypothetical protein